MRNAIIMTALAAAALLASNGAYAQMCGGSGSSPTCGMGQPAQEQWGQSSMPGMSMPGMGGMMHGQPQPGAAPQQGQGMMMQGCPMMKQIAALSERVRQMEDMMRPGTPGAETPKH